LGTILKSSPWIIDETAPITLDLYAVRVYQYHHLTVGIKA